MIRNLPPYLGAWPGLDQAGAAVASSLRTIAVAQLRSCVSATLMRSIALVIASAGGNPVTALPVMTCGEILASSPGPRGRNRRVWDAQALVGLISPYEHG